MYDVVIIGAGVAGCSTAIALKNQNKHLKIAIIERGSYENTTRRIGETLPPQASNQFQKLGIWEAFLACNFLSSYGTSSVWGSSELYTNEYIYSPFGYGWNLDRSVFDRFMMNETQQRGVDFFFKTSCTTALKSPSHWQLTCFENTNEKQIAARFVVDASGKKAAFTSLQGISKITNDTLVGIYRFYDTNTNNELLSLKKGTLVETDANGWWYSATLPNNKLVIGYMTDADIATKLNLKSKASFENLLNTSAYTTKRIPKHSSYSENQLVAAQSQYVTNCVGEAWLAVGDAASSYDPISSMGIYKSLVMSQFATFAILDYLKNETLGLRKYEYIVQQDYTHYEAKKAKYYSQEQRYKESAFWQRRQKQKLT